MAKASPTEALYAGCMSGTSLDGIDLVIADLAAATPRLIAARTLDIPAPLRRDLLTLCQPGADHLELFGYCDVVLAETIACGLNDLLAEHAIEPARILALGSHGQTVRHQPGGQHPFTLQIGDPNVIAERTGLTVVADFRRRDLAAGGQGAPLVPAFHAALFTAAEDRVIVNIGGMANITILPAGQPAAASGFDTGPGNVLLDAWAERELGRPLDDGGQWASQARPDPELLAALWNDPYFERAAPKSTGREHFNMDWLQARLKRPVAPAVVQATLTELTARSITHGIHHTAGVKPKQVLVCGGGRHNTLLMQRLAIALPDAELGTTEQLGLDGDWVEAVAFAWLAKQRLDGLPGNLPAVTGAAGPRILGAIYPGN
ncbi:MAG: anhydro-N-acetylmuramic acid kinase [Gammaproteobacteria bacterium]|nr:anhydro-N-acetylmuramic acid kinase [Gammaproteobacteria bacterium]